MPHTLFLAPSGSAAGLTSVALGLLRALDSRGVRVAFFKPIGQFGAQPGVDRSTHFVQQTMALEPTPPIDPDEAERLILSQRTDELMSRVIGNFHRSAGGADLVIVEGLVHSPETPLEVELNSQLIQTLSAEVILVGAYGDATPADFVERIGLAALSYTAGHGALVLG